MNPVRQNPIGSLDSCSHDVTLTHPHNLSCPLQSCSSQPVTDLRRLLLPNGLAGPRRTCGLCRDDRGFCYTKSKGNDLSTPAPCHGFVDQPGAIAGVCVQHGGMRYYQGDKVPPVVLSGTDQRHWTLCRWKHSKPRRIDRHGPQIAMTLGTGREL